MAIESQEKRASGSGTIPVLAVRNLTKLYRVGQTHVRALRGISLDVYPNEFVAIMGASGSGKSTFMNLIGCLDQPTSGEYRLMGTSVSYMTAKELATIRNQYLGFVFQGFHLLPRATALHNVALPLLYAGVLQEERERRARKALEVVGLATRLNHTPSQLSGGQQQRVAIARALVNNPLLLLADEPTGNLDSRTSAEIMALLQDLNRNGLTIVLVTHESDIAAYAKRRVTFRDGRILSDESTTPPPSAQANGSIIHGQVSQNSQPPAQASAEETAINTTRVFRQEAKPLGAKEIAQRSVVVPLQEQPLRIANSPNSSRQPSPVHRFQISVLPLLILLGLFLSLLTSVGIGVGLWLYTANHHTTGSTPPTPIHRIASTPSAVSTAYPDVVKSYNGTIDGIPGNVTTLMSLTNIQQQQNYITGSFAGLHENGPFRGTVTPDKHIQFVVMANAQHAPIAFDGFILPNATISGTYCVQNPAGQCSDYGVWSLSPAQS